MIRKQKMPDIFARLAAQDQIGVLPSIIGGAMAMIAVPASSQEFSVQEHFIVGDGPKAKVKISFISPSFRRSFLKKIEEHLSDSIICGRRLIKTAMNSLIIAQLGGRDKSEITLAEVYAVMEHQADGDIGCLAINGQLNIFNVKDINGLMQTMILVWRSGGWEMGAVPAEIQYELCAGCRIFSRI